METIGTLLEQLRMGRQRTKAEDTNLCKSAQKPVLNLFFLDR